MFLVDSGAATNLVYANILSPFNAKICELSQLVGLLTVGERIFERSQRVTRCIEVFIDGVYESCIRKALVSL
jgi:hypothetical protein